MKPRNPLIATAVFAILLVGVALAVFGFRFRSSGPAEPIAAVLYACEEGKTISAAYYPGASESSTIVVPEQPPQPSGYVHVSLSDGRELELPQTISADGARYANADESVVFWSKGNGALVLENNEEKSYIGCIAVAPEPSESSLPAVYANNGLGVSIRLPGIATTTEGASGYRIDEAYRYQGPRFIGEIFGVRFSIPARVASGTNLAADSYFSIEEVPHVDECSAERFLGADGRGPSESVADDGITYSFASSTDAAAGNRYEEYVYALTGTNPCVAVRYFIHYGVFENYPAGSIERFDRAALLAEFDAMRRTLVVRQ